MQLPTEICDIIFEILAEDPCGPDIDALQACNLVSSQFSNTCERHIYACVYLYGENGPYVNAIEQPDRYNSRCRITIQRFATTLAAKPHLANHVKRLGILFLGVGNHDYAILGEWWNKIWGIVSQLQPARIQWFKVYQATYCDLAEPEYSHIERTLLHVLSSPNLTTLHIYGFINFPIHEAFAPHFCIRHVDVGLSMNYKESDSDSHQKSIVLDSLTIRTYDNLFSRMLHRTHPNGVRMVDLSSMLRFCSPTTDEGIYRLRTIVRLASNSLEEVAVKYMYEGRAEVSMLMNSSNEPLWDALSPAHKTLKHLVLMLTRDDTNDADLTFEGLNKFFTLPDNTCYPYLAEMRVQINLGDWPKLELLSVDEEHHLTELVEALCDEQTFPYLKKVGISLGLDEIRNKSPSGRVTASSWWDNVARLLGEKFEDTRSGRIKLHLPTPITDRTYDYFLG